MTTEDYAVGLHSLQKNPNTLFFLARLVSSSLTHAHVQVPLHVQVSSCAKFRTYKASYVMISILKESMKKVSIQSWWHSKIIWSVL